MGEAQLVHRTPVPLPEVARGDEREELDGDPVTTEHPGLQLDLLHLHQGGELVAHPVGGHHLESEARTVEAHGQVEIRDTDPEV